MQRTNSGSHEIAQLLSVVQARRQYYRDVLSLLPVGVAVVAGDGAIRYANDAFCGQFAIPPESAATRAIGNILPSDVLNRRILAARLSGMAQGPFQLQIGNAAWSISITAVDYFKNNREIDCLLLVDSLQEVRLARRKADKSNLSLALPEDLADDAIPAIVWQADRFDLVFHSVRGAAREIIGFPEDHWKSTPDFFAARIHSEDRAATLACYRSVIENGGDASAEFRGLSSAGFVWLRENIRVAGTMVTGVATPIGGLKIIEQQRLRFERTRAFNGLAKGSAACLDDAVSTVLSSSFASGSDELKDALARVSRITGEINRDFVQSNPPTILNLPRFLQQLRGQLAAIAGANVLVEIQTHPSLLSFAEEGQLEEALVALTASICRDALPGSRLSITCDLHTVNERVPGATLSPGNYARVAFRHQGRGLEFELQEPLFESRFSFPHPKQATAPALTRAYAMVRDLGGDLAFFTEPDCATFFLFVPHCPSFDLEQEPAPIPAAGEAEEQDTSYRDLVDLFLAELAEESAAETRPADSLPLEDLEIHSKILERPLL